MQAAGKGALLIDLSASTPSFARELNAVAVVSDLMSVEAPLVVVDVARADAFGDRDNLVCFVGGDEEAVAEARPVLEAIAGTVQETGGAGSAQLARAAYTLQTTAQVISAVEADALYRAVRRSSASLDQATERVGAATPVAEQVLAAVNTGRFDGMYTVEMFMAELSAALTAADDVDLILPQAEACLHLLELLAVIGGSDKAPAALALVYGEKTCAEQASTGRAPSRPTATSPRALTTWTTTATTTGTTTVPSAIIRLRRVFGQLGFRRLRPTRSCRRCGRLWHRSRREAEDSRTEISLRGLLQDALRPRLPHDLGHHSRPL
ncbi:MAG: NAD(P)-binding domain-containing protein [Eggerthella lenta]